MVDTMEAPATTKKPETAAETTAASEAKPSNGTLDLENVLEVAQAAESPPASPPEAMPANPSTPVEDELAALRVLVSELRTKLGQVTEHEHRVMQAEANVAAKETVVTACAAELKEAKKEFDDAVSVLRSEIRRRDGQGQLPFPDDAKPVVNETIPVATETSTAVAPVAVEQPADDAWRKVTIDELGLKGKMLESLAEAGLITLGAIADYTADDKRLIDLNGIGKGKAEKIEQAMERYWETHPRPAPKPVLHPALTSTTTPAGIALHDPDVQSDVSGQQETAAIAAGAETPEETAAYAAGCEANILKQSVATNPHRKGTRLWKFWDRGWQETFATGEAEDEPLGNEYNPNNED